MSKQTQSTVLVIGASRGLGRGLVERYLERGWNVVGTQRNAGNGKGLSHLAKQDDKLSIEHVDIDYVEQIKALRDRLDGRMFDLVFINAGIVSDPRDAFADQVAAVMRTNVAGAMNAATVLLDRVKTDGCLAVMSSGLGSISANISGGWEPYRSSKAALNQSLRSLAAEQPNLPFALTAVAPGWVRTEMGGPGAALDVETSTRGMADMLEHRMGARGLAFLSYEGKTIDW